MCAHRRRECKYQTSFCDAPSSVSQCHERWSLHNATVPVHTRSAMVVITIVNVSKNELKYQSKDDWMLRANKNEKLTRLLSSKAFKSSVFSVVVWSVRTGTSATMALYISVKQFIPYKYSREIGKHFLQVGDNEGMKSLFKNETR